MLGVSSGAAFGVIVAQVFGLGGSLVEAVGLAACAFAGALVAGGAVYLIASRAGGLPVHTLLLAGVIVGIFFSSAITVLISIVDFDRLGGVVHWLLGNLGPVAPGSLVVFAALTALGGWLVIGAARRLNLLALGEETAQQLGVDALGLKRRIFAGAALLTSAAVAFAGPIGFVGLIVPQSLRLLLGSGQPGGDPGGPARRRRLSPARRHGGPQRDRPRRALGRRHHRLLRDPVLHLSAARARGEPAPVTPLRRLPRVAFAYRRARPGAEAFAIRDLSFDVRPGETFGVIGPNASGKTTLVRLLSRVLRRRTAGSCSRAAT